MEITLEIVKGAERGQRFVIARNEPDNIIVGRTKMAHSSFDDECSQLLIAKSEKSLSRRHFILQIRPPYCYIRDAGSRNRTFVNDFHRDRYIRDTVEVKDGDVIKAGKVYLKVAIRISAHSEVEHYCMLCKRELSDEDLKTADGMTSNDLLCSECRRGFNEGGRAGRFERRVEYTCSRCGVGLGARANADGRADELGAVALYYCEKCAYGEREDKGAIDDYILLRKLGEGGMGFVHMAWHEPTHRLVALKTIRTENKIDEKMVMIFLREINVMQNLVHPNIVRFYESGTFEGNPYFTCEYLPGGSIESRYAQKKSLFTPRETCEMMVDVLRGLAYAHEKGFVHRDVQPRNMLFTSGDTVKLSDMGLSKSFENAGQSNITSKGEAGGSLMFIAPEQITDYRYVKPSADIYSLGVAMYYILTKRYPYDFPSHNERLYGRLGYKEVRDPISIILRDDPIPIRERRDSIPESMAAIIDKCLNKKCCDRYDNAGDVLKSIEGVIGTL